MIFVLAHAHYFGGFFFVFFIALLLTLLVVKLFWFRRGWRYAGGDDAFRPDNILKRRLASGEITEAEYQRLRDTLSK
jgi:uncharacterized membrane protein